MAREFRGLRDRVVLHALECGDTREGCPDVDEGHLLRHADDRQSAPLGPGDGAGLTQHLAEVLGLLEHQHHSSQVPYLPLSLRAPLPLGQAEHTPFGRPKCR